ncbi:MAG: sugar transferase [Phycisphaeraceae bacterium]
MDQSLAQLEKATNPPTRSKDAAEVKCKDMHRRAKRVLDIAGALLGLAVAAPIVAGCAVWICLMDRGPAFYRQWRVGQDGWLFPIYKLRTMRQDSERHGEACFAANADPRVLRGCGLMRKMHLDELPQLWNILTGDMSLVGPRPERPEIVERLRQAIPQIDRRTECRPGLTGLAQVRQGYTNDVTGARRKVAFDLCYLRRQSLAVDLALLLRTIPRLWDRAAL